MAVIINITSAIAPKINSPKKNTSTPSLLAYALTDKPNNKAAKAVNFKRFLFRFFILLLY